MDSNPSAYKPELALSSFWSSGRRWRPLDFFAAARDLGFKRFELSGVESDTFYDEVKPGDCTFVSLHDPAPPARGTARVGSKKLRRVDITCTSLDEGRRREAVGLIRRSIQVAAEYGSPVVVLHVGQTSASIQIAQRLDELYRTGRIGQPVAATVRAELHAARKWQHEEHMAALRRSLDELIPYAAARHIRLGLENRPSIEIPDFLEMGYLLAQYDEKSVGYWHDTGHAQHQALLGGTPHVDWLKVYGERLIGMHLHDIVEVHVHRAPGTGSIDWQGLAPHIRPNIIKTLEVDCSVTPDEIRRGVECLRSTGCLGK